MLSNTLLGLRKVPNEECGFVPFTHWTAHPVVGILIHGAHLLGRMQFSPHCYATYIFIIYRTCLGGTRSWTLARDARAWEEHVLLGEVHSGVCALLGMHTPGMRSPGRHTLLGSCSLAPGACSTVHAQGGLFVVLSQAWVSVLLFKLIALFF